MAAHVGHVGLGSHRPSRNLSSSRTAAPTGFNGVRVVSLILLALSIAFCVQAIITYHKRAKLLDMRRSDGFDDNVAPIGMALSLVVALGAIYLVSLFKKSPVPH
jgi:hypothetical protein